jgi:hypothetical protein
MKDILEVDERITEKGKIKLVYVRVKKAQEQTRTNRKARNR